MNRFFRNLLIGKDAYVLSKTDFKRAMFMGYLSLFGALACFFLYILSLKTEPYGTIYYLEFLTASLIIIYLSRRRKYVAAAGVYYVAAILVTYQIASTEPFATGAYIFFLIASVAIIAFLGYEQRKLGFLISLLSIILFICAYFFDFFPQRDLPDNYIEVHFISNFFIALIASYMIVYFLISIHHSSEQTLKENEKSIQAKNAELIKVNAELDRFVYSASHDMRAPLSSILGLISITEKTNSPEDLKKYLDMMKKRIITLESFIREIMDYSRNARAEVVLKPVNLQTAVRSVMEELRFIDGSEKIRFTVDVPVTEIFTDDTRLRVVLQNLIGNAIRYYDPVKADHTVSITFRIEKNWACISVLDNGPGIHPDHVSRIFDMFYRGSDRSSGSGLGLYIVKETLGRIKGTIEVKSSFGRGSEFTVRLPLPVPRDT